jgi:competence protein ComGC
MITCPECGKSISSEAASCPSCGYPVKLDAAASKKTGLWWGLGCLLAVPALLTVIAIIGIIAAIAIPSFVKAKEISQQNVCINNIKMIEEAKTSAVQKYNHKNGDTIPSIEISEFIRNGLNSLKCPNGGIYTVNPAGQPPQCSIHDKGDQPHPSCNPE